jgi:hypothetical protein
MKVLQMGKSNYFADGITELKGEGKGIGVNITYSKTTVIIMKKCPICDTGKLKKGEIEEEMFGIPLGRYEAEMCNTCGESSLHEGKEIFLYPEGTTKLAVEISGARY